MSRITLAAQSASAFYHPILLTAPPEQLCWEFDRLMVAPDKWIFHRFADVLLRRDLPEAFFFLLWRHRAVFSELSFTDVARHPCAPPEFLELLGFEATNVWVLRKVAFNPRTPAPVLEVLAAHESLTVRVGVAMNPAAPGELLERLSLERSKQLQTKLVANPRWLAYHIA